MPPLPTGSPSDSTGPPDRQTLRLLEKHLADDPLVTDTGFEPDSYEPHLLCAQLDIERYPASIDAVRLDIRWFISGDFSLHYVEASSDGTHWECRWDRHPNDHNSRVHFHRPPNGTDGEDLSLPSLHPLDVYSTVLDAVEQRVETHWDREQ